MIKDTPVKGQESMTPLELAQQQICSFLFPAVKPYNTHMRTGINCSTREHI